MKPAFQGIEKKPPFTKVETKPSLQVRNLSYGKSDMSNSELKE